jgi:2-desacetyl-2-hydroxyethyl bacteriochlorophyllide A dehydrogenase
VRLDVAFCGVCGTDLHIAHGAMDDRIRPPQVIGHEMSGTVAELGAEVDGLRVGDPVVVRPLDTRGETPADRGHSHIGRNLKFLGIDAPGALQASWTVPAFTVHRVPDGLDLRQAAFAEPLAVACHDVRRGEVAAGQLVLVIGGGPIGVLIALVARARGARVLLVEIDERRRALADALGLTGLEPGDAVDAAVAAASGGAGVDVVFEVSGSAPGILAATKHAAIRGRVVVVAIYPEPKPVALFDLFWKELEVRGARVYEPEDFEAALELLADGSLPIDRLLTAVEPIARVPELFAELLAGREAMKILVDCRG